MHQLRQNSYIWVWISEKDPAHWFSNVNISWCINSLLPGRYSTIFKYIVFITLYRRHKCNTFLIFSFPFKLELPTTWCQSFNTLRPRQNGRHFEDILKCIFLNENVWISIKISLKFVHKSPINNIPALVQIMAWRRPGTKPLYEPMLVSLLTHICVTQPQWVKQIQV